MQFRQIEVFHAVMTTGSTTGAAARLRITQPAVSTTLARMQDELGLVLFTRRSGRLVPTPEAELLARQTATLMEDAEQLQRTARRLAEGRMGHVRLGMVPALGEGVAARAIAAMRARSPGVSISLDVMNTHDLLHRLRAARIDLAVVFGRPERTGVEILQSVSCPLSAVVPATWMLKGGTVVLSDLGDHPLALMRPTDPIGAVVSEHLKGMTSTIEVRTSRAAIAMARAGVAIGIADAFTLREQSVEGASVHDLEPPLIVEMSLVRESGRVESIPERYLIEALRAELDLNRC
jgi:DNA-binding transcriptional LysR family regulator